MLTYDVIMQKLGSIATKYSMMLEGAGSVNVRMVMPIKAVGPKPRNARVAQL